jgi:hypothetical protein
MSVKSEAGIQFLAIGNKSLNLLLMAGQANNFRKIISYGDVMTKENNII